jgi:hypothetical protein
VPREQNLAINEDAVFNRHLLYFSYFIEKQMERMPLITIPRRIVDPNNDAPAKYKQKPTLL